MALRDSQFTNETKSKEKLAVITGNWASGQKNPSGVFLEGELQARFETFLRFHEGKVIDWHVAQDSMSVNWIIFIRYKT